MELGGTWASALVYEVPMTTPNSNPTEEPQVDIRADEDLTFPGNSNLSDTAMLSGTNPSFRGKTFDDAAGRFAETEGSEDFSTNVGMLLEEEVGFTTSPVREETSRCNVGRTEQKLRWAAGAALLGAAAFAPLSRGWRIGLGVLGVAEIITGTTRYCPASQLLGINTCRADER